MRLWLRNTYWNWQREFNNLVVKVIVAVKEKYSIVSKKLSRQKQIYWHLRLLNNDTKVAKVKSYT